MNRSDAMGQFVSPETKKNWDKLNVSNYDRKLKSRANKKLSNRLILPMEYFSNRENVPLIQRLIDDVFAMSLPVGDVLYSLALRCLENKSLMISGKPQKNNVKKLLKAYKHLKLIEYIYDYTLPKDEADLLGLIYQSLKTEGAKNERGMYYTPPPIAREMLENLQFSKGQKILDPCCGSSVFFLCLDEINPHQLYGIDSDPVAVMISRFNLIMKFPAEEFDPQITLADYTQATSLFRQIEFDYVVTNPPWGAVSGLPNGEATGESFSVFLRNSLGRLKPGGLVHFLLPESFLNVRKHRDIREHILSSYCLEKVTVYPNLFAGVSTRFVSAVIKNEPQRETVLIDKLDRTTAVSVESFRKNKNIVFSLTTERDARILDHVYARKTYDLSRSVWALGIVTGDNREKLSGQFLEGWEPIYTGKEIRRYRLLPHKNYIEYDRKKLQQAARDEVYRAPEKLVYKFITSRPVFAYDASGSLFLNSANILIPNVPGFGIKTVMSLLNSGLFAFIYMKKFGEVKMLKGNLMELPFPEIIGETERLLSGLADNAMGGDRAAEEEISRAVYELFGLDSASQDYIESVLNGLA